MQNIQINLENENGQSIEKSNINFADIIAVLWKYGNEKEYPWLWTIDPYGDTVFNIHQIPKITEELSTLSLKVKDKKIVDEIKDTIDFIKKIEQHLYIKFIGD